MKNIYNYQVKLQSVFMDRTDNTIVQLFRYTFVGGFAFSVDFSSLYILTEFIHIHYLISAGIAFIFGLIVNYFLSLKWVFSNRSIENRLVEFMLFTIIGLVGLGLNEFLMWIFTDTFKMYYLISKVITAFTVYFWNFFARKILLFNKLKI